MKKIKINWLHLFLILLFACGCTGSTFVEIQAYELQLQDYAVGMKTKKVISSNAAMIELRYGYNPDYMTDNQRILDNEQYNFSLRFTGSYYFNSTTTFLSFRQPLDNFVLDESNAFAKVEKTGFIQKMGRKITFNKSIEYAIDFENIPNTYGYLQLALMMPKKAQAEEDYSPLLVAKIRFVKTESKISFSKYY